VRALGEAGHGRGLQGNKGKRSRPLPSRLPLGIAQQTLSAQIRTLERRLGVTLFSRDRRHVALTPAGRAFAEQGRRLLRDAGRLVDTVRETRAPVRVDVLGEGLASTRLIHQLHAEAPESAFEVVLGHGLAAALPQLRAGSLDLAFGRAHGLGRPLDPPLVSMPVGLEPIGLVLPIDHPLAAADAVPLTALAEHRLLVHGADESTEWRDWVDQAVAAFGLQVASRVRGHGRTSALAAVQALGLPAFGLVAATPLPAGLTTRPLVEPVPLLAWHAVWNSATPHPEIQRILDVVHAYARAQHWNRPPAAPWWLPLPDRDELRTAG
jgi:DNA-binding transcriptional LysR family regulator